jgi:hypothetical protein
MPANGNFDPFANRTAAGIRVTGRSQRIDGADLVSRHVAIRQDTVFAMAEADDASPWAATVDAAGFVDGAALATGTETHFVRPGTDNPGAVASFLTMTWSENVEIR